MKPYLNKLQTLLRKSTLLTLFRLGSLFSRMSCPVCNNKVLFFKPISNNYIEQLYKTGWPYDLERMETLNAKKYICPICGATDRDRLICLYLEHVFSNNRSVEFLRILDIAPSEPLSKYIRKKILRSKIKAEYRSTDLYMSNVDDNLDITDMNIYPDEHFQVVICSHVLEHVENDEGAIKEIFRVLSVDGVGIVLVPIVLGVDKIDEDAQISDETTKWRRFGQGDHIRLYSKEGLIRRLSQYFEVHQIGINFFRNGIFQKTAITPTSTLYILNKSSSKT